jgi:outer membrane biosynthesis protein TonB
MSHAISMSQTPVASRVIPALVVCLHAVVLTAILWGHFLQVEPPSKPPGMEVHVVFAPPTDEQDAVEDSLPAPQPEPIPDPPEKPVVKPVDRPVPPPEIPKPKPDIPKPKPDIPKPKPVVAEKPVVKPPEKKKDEWRPTSLKDMRERVAQNNPQPVRPHVDVNEIARELSKAAAPVSIPHPAPRRPVGDPRSTIREADFEAAVAGVVGQYWSQNFAASELNGPGREVLVKFVIRRDGSVASARITKFSHVGPVDGRAARAVQKIKARGFPPLGNYGIQSATYEVEVRFGVEE